MSKRHLLLAALAIAFVQGCLGVKETASKARPSTQTAPAGRPWSVVRTSEFTIAVPKGWRRMPQPIGAHVLYLSGDGIGAPLVDETGGPIQIGMTVERYEQVKDSAPEGAKRNLRTLKHNPRLKVLSQDPVKSLKLSDGTQAAAIRVVLEKDRTRKSLQMKVFAKDGNARGWVVVGWIVTGRDSQFIQNNQALENWLRAHMASLCFDPKKFSTRALAAAYGLPPTQAATSRSQ